MHAVVVAIVRGAIRSQIFDAQYSAAGTIRGLNRLDSFGSEQHDDLSLQIRQLFHVQIAPAFLNVVAEFQHTGFGNKHPVGAFVELQDQELFRLVQSRTASPVAT